VDIDSLAQSLGSSAIFFAAAAWVAKSWLGNFFSRDLEKHKLRLMAEQTQQFVEMQHRFALELERFRSEVQTQTAQKDRIREEILRWANPILEYVNSLHGRLRNIVKHKGYLALKNSIIHSGLLTTINS